MVTSLHGAGVRKRDDASVLPDYSVVSKLVEKVRVHMERMMDGEHSALASLGAP
jgi:hypothetical protein